MNCFNLPEDELYRIVFQINEKFYDKVYSHPWLKDIFVVIDQTIITKQQTDFMVQNFGGYKRYGGRSPEDAHVHIFVTEDMWQVREDLLVETFKDLKTPIEIQERWLKIDNAFKKAILKNDISECIKRYKTDVIINVPRPKN